MSFGEYCPMMEAKPITVSRSAVALKTRRGPLDPRESLYIDSSVFVAACGCSPTGAADTTDSRYRVKLSVDGWPGDSLDGIYYVSGWLDEGLCGLEPDKWRTRREAVLAQKARKSRRLLSLLYATTK